MLDDFNLTVVHCYSFYILIRVYLNRQNFPDEEIQQSKEWTPLLNSSCHCACSRKPAIICHLKYWFCVQDIRPLYKIIAHVNMFCRALHRTFHSTESNAFLKSKKEINHVYFLFHSTQIHQELTQRFPQYICLLYMQFDFH